MKIDAVSVILTMVFIAFGIKYFFTLHSLECFLLWREVLAHVTINCSLANIFVSWHLWQWTADWQTLLFRTLSWHSSFDKCSFIFLPHLSEGCLHKVLLLLMTPTKVKCLNLGWFCIDVCLCRWWVVDEILEGGGRKKRVGEGLG